jgi:membrane protein
MMDYREPVARDDGSLPATDTGGASRERVVVQSARRWRDILFAVIGGISTDRVFLVAAGVAFYAILALFPGIGMLVSIYGLFADPGGIAGHLDTLSGFAPGGALEVVHGQLAHLTQQSGTALGLGFVASLLIAIWSANAGVSGLFDALTLVYEEKNRRSLLQFYAITLAFTCGAIVLVLLLIAILVAVPLVLEYLPSPGIAMFLLNIVRWPALFAIIVASLTLVYRYGPCRNAPQWRAIVLCSLFAASAWLCVSALFSWYVANFGSYNKTYGSLGAIFGFITWMWISMVVVLVGGKLEAELEHRSGSTANAPE